VQEQQGRGALAVASLRRASELSSGDPVILASLAHACALNGQTREARKILKELRAESARRYIPPYSMALIHTGLGEREQAYEWLGKAVELRDINVLWLASNPRFDALREETEFTELLRRGGVPRAAA
jgi:Flp pilus assembly protein TadD